MPIRKSEVSKFDLIPADARPKRQAVNRKGIRAISRAGKATSTMPAKNGGFANEYLCAIEKNRNGKYNVRLQAIFGLRGEGKDSGHAGRWDLSVYFLASSFNGAMKKLEESLQLLQKNEERLRFWSVERSDDPNVAGDILKEFGLWLDRRKETPAKTAEILVAPEKAVPASMLAPVRRILANSVASARSVYDTALAGD